METWQLASSHHLAIGKASSRLAMHICFVSLNLTLLVVKVFLPRLAKPFPAWVEESMLSCNSWLSLHQGWTPVILNWLEGAFTQTLSCLSVWLLLPPWTNWKLQKRTRTNKRTQCVMLPPADWKVSSWWSGLLNQLLKEKWEISKRIQNITFETQQ